MPLSEQQELELERIRSDDPGCVALRWGGTLVNDGGLDDSDIKRLVDAISCDLTLRNHHLRSISIRNNTKISESSIRGLITVLPHSRIVAVDSMNVRIAGQVRADLKDAIAENVVRVTKDLAAKDDSAEREAAEREAKRQAAVVEAATARDQQQRPKGCVASMPVTLHTHALRPTVIGSKVAWRPADKVDQDDERSLTEHSRPVVIRGALTDERPQLDAQRRRKQHRLCAEEREPIDRRNRNRARASAHQPSKPAVLKEQGRPVVCGRRGRPVAPEKVLTVKELRHRAIMQANGGGNKGTLLHVAARSTIMTQPVRARTPHSEACVSCVPGCSLTTLTRSHVGGWAGSVGSSSHDRSD